jgi:hypothetical protein
MFSFWFFLLFSSGRPRFNRRSAIRGKITPRATNRDGFETKADFSGMNEAKRVMKNCDHA